MHGVLDQTAYEFINDVYRSLYQESFKKLVFPSLKTMYQRCSLVHKSTAEKITIDLNLAFGQIRGGDEIFQAPHLVIIELKSEVENSPTKAIFDQYDMMPSKPCSKYCIGNYFLGNVKEWNRFIPTIKTIQAIIHNENLVKKPRKELKKFQTTQLLAFD